MEKRQKEGAPKPCDQKSKSKTAWAFRLKDGMQKVVFRRRADNTWAPMYTVQRGDVFYNGLGGAGRRPDIIGDDATLAIQVTRALPGKHSELSFVLYRIDSEGVFRRIGSASCTQERFVRILRDGVPSKK